MLNLSLSAPDSILNLNPRYKSRPSFPGRLLNKHIFCYIFYALLFVPRRRSGRGVRALVYQDSGPGSIPSKVGTRQFSTFSGNWLWSKATRNGNCHHNVVALKKWKPNSSYTKDNSLVLKRLCQIFIKVYFLNRCINDGRFWDHIHQIAKGILPEKRHKAKKAMMKKS